MNTLNDEQHTVVHAINAMQARDRLVVSGRAGSGKTYAIARSVADRKALFLTPTHPAKAVLEQELNDTPHNVMTIQKAIGWYTRRDDNLESVDVYRPAKDAKPSEKKLFSELDIIIVDEFSMVGAFLFGAIEEYAQEFNLPVVYSGDRFQLPPVGDREVIMDQGFPTITLDSSMRFPEDSEIFRLGEALRDSIENRPDEDLPCLIGCAEVQVVPGASWMGGFTTGYSRGDNLLAVTSNNKRLLSLRNKVRKSADDQFASGDIVMSKQTDEVFRNGEELVTSGVVPDTLTLEDVPGCVSQTHELVVHGYTVSFKDSNKVAFILKDGKEKCRIAKRMQNLFKKEKLNRVQASRVLDWVDQFNSFELSALSTVHKSQGRSVDTVYIDTSTVLKKPHRMSPVNHKRLLYTAITRARKQVVFYEMSGFCQQTPPDYATAA